MKYQNQNRGNRLYPKRSNRVYWHLTSLRITIENILNNFNNKFDKVLDYGCGNKPYKELFTGVCNNYFGADLQGNNFAEIIINTDGTLPTENQTFDCVLSSQVLEHVENPLLYLAEAYRVLKEDGLIILSTHGYWQYHPDPNDFWRWTSAGLKKILVDAGFKIENIYSIQTFPSISLQLWLDATLHKIPRIFKGIYSLFFQLAMETIDKKTKKKFSENAGVFIVVAKKKI